MSGSNTRAPRYRVPGFSVAYDTGREFWAGRVVDASESGVFIETSHRLPVGTRVSIIPAPPHDAQLPFEITALVARAKEVDLDNSVDRLEGLAFRFDDMASADLEALRSFLRVQGVLV